MYEIRLDEDIYSIGYITFLKATNTKQLERIVMKCLFAFMVQALLSFLLINQYADAQGSLLTNLVPGDVKLNCSRLLCSFLLH